MLLKRALVLLTGTALLTGCSLLGLSDNEDSRIDIEDIEPTVSFIDRKQVTIPKSDIEDVSAEQVIASYRRLMESPHQEVRRQAMRRLADLNMRLTEAKNNAIADGTPEDQLPPAIANATYQKAAELYQRVIDEFPQQADDSSIRYQLARALALDGKQDESLSQLDELASIHDSADELVEVEFRRGEAYFLRREYSQAALAYQAVVDAGDETDFFDKALYKLGWSQFKMIDYDSALTSFFPLLERLKEAEQLNDDVKLVLADLIGDTHRAISLSFYNLDGPESVSQYFTTVGEKAYQAEIYQKLAELYLLQNRFQDAAKTYLTYIENNPLSDESPRFQLAVIKTYLDGGFPSLLLPAKEDFLTKFGVKSAFWKQASEPLQDELKPSIKVNLDEISSHYHSLAQKSELAADYLVAAEWYSHFLILLSEESEVAGYHYLMAEALFDAGDYSQAIEQFAIIAYQYQTYEKREDAGYFVLLGLQELESQAQDEPSRLQLQQQSIDYTLKFAAAFPAAEKAAELMLRAIEQQLIFEKIPEAIESSQILLALTGPKTPEQTDRAKVVIANGWFDLKDFMKAEQAITIVLTETSLVESERLAFRERRAQSIYKQAEAFQAAGDNQQAITEFQRVALVEPNSEIRPNAEIDAAALLMQLENWSDAKIALEGFRGRFSAHPLAEGLNEKLALVYENLQEWSNAAVAYTAIGDETQDPEKARDIVWYVAGLHIKADDPVAAIDSYKKYVWTYPDPYDQAQEGRAKLIDLYGQTEQYDKQVFWRNKIIEFYRAAGADNTARTQYLAAKSSFELAEPLFDTFKAIQLSVPLPSSLKKKRGAMDRALAAYGEVGGFKVAEYTTASTHRVGQLYQILATDIINSERPEGMNEEESEEYGYLIEDQAFPIEEKAIEIYQSNSNRVAANIYDDWVKRSFQALAKLQPARYDKQEVLELWFGVSPQ